RQLLELRPSQAQHQTVAQGSHGCGAGTAREEGDLAHRLTRAELGHRLASAGYGDGEASGDDDIERIRRLALAHEFIPALQVQCLELGGEPRALALLQVAEDLDAIEAVLGNFGFHRWSCWPYSLGGQPSSCPRIREPDDPDTRQLLAASAWRSVCLCVAALAPAGHRPQSCE